MRPILLGTLLGGLCLFAVGPGPVRGQQAPPSPPSGKVILDTASLWRYRLVWETEEIRLASGEVGHFRLKRDRKTKAVTPEKGSKVHVVPPVTSADWMRPDFDDSAWGRFRGPFSNFDTGMKLLLMRGRFMVADPAAAGDLRLGLTFMGGAVVHLNGQELTRVHMPDGRITLRTAAVDYPVEAYTDTDGYILTESSHMRRRYPDRYKQRIRELAEVRVPAALLRKGVNVLAVAIHRPPAHHVMYSHRIRAYDMTAYDSRSRASWGRTALLSLRLVALPGSNVVPNLARPEGAQVWNQNAACKVYTADYGDPGGRVRPVRIVGARNSLVSGEVVLGSTGPIKGLKVEVPDLTGPIPSVIPASAVRVRYALPDGEERRWRGKLSMGAPFDSLADAAPAEVPVRADGAGPSPAEAGFGRAGGAVQPVRISVAIPADAAPGDYTGQATLRADGLDPVAVPLTVKVLGWTMPDSTDFVVRPDIVQSPESVAMRYGVPLWSEQHWALLDRTFRLLGQLANKTLYVTCIRRTHFGNEHAMIRWTRRADGTLAPDFSIAERYLDTAVRHMGRAPAVVLYCWEPPNSVGHAGFGPGRTHDRDILISVLDPDTGELTRQVGPKWGSRECRLFWQSLVEPWRRMLEKRGLGESLMFGLVGDHRPTKQAMDDVCGAAPKAPWAVHSHHYTHQWQGYPVGFCAAVWGIKCLIVDPDRGHGYGWQNGFWLVSYPRGIHTGSLLPEYRAYTERYLGAVPWNLKRWPKARGVWGIGRIGADFWRVVKDRSGRRRASIAGRYPETAWGQLNITYATSHILGAGPNGPVPTYRSEAYRENFQEIEARVFIEKALLDQRARARLGEDLARRCRALLDERIRACIRTAEPNGWAWFLASGWQQRTERLYGLAAEVAGKLNAR